MVGATVSRKTVDGEAVRRVAEARGVAPDAVKRAIKRRRTEARDRGERGLSSLGGDFLMHDFVPNDAELQAYVDRVNVVQDAVAAIYRYASAAWHESVKGVATTSMPEYVVLEIQTRIKALMGILAAARPGSICLECRTREMPECKTCQGRGWLCHGEKSLLLMKNI